MTIRSTIISFSIVNALLFIALMVGFTVFSNHQGEKLERLVKRDLAFSRAVDQTYSTGLRAGIALRNLVINPQDEIALSTFETARKEFVAKANESARINSGKAGILMGEAVGLWAQSEAIKDTIVRLIKEDSREQIMPVVGQDTDNWREIKQVIDRARIEQDKELNVAIQQNRETIRRGKTAIGAIMVIGIAGLLVTVTISFRRILRPLDQLVSAVSIVGNGDLRHTIPVTSRDELGILASEFNAMVSKLSAMVVNLTTTSHELQKAAFLISDAAKGVVSSSTTQVSGVDETFRSVMEITSLIQSVGQHVDSLANSAGESAASTHEIAANIKEVAYDVEGLDSSVEEVSSSIIQMSASVRQINSSVQRLSDVALSTASSIAEMDSSIKEVERSALETVEISQILHGDATVGRASVEATIKGILEIRQASEQTSQAITSLDAKTGDIGKILQVIDDVAEQTNLLALNASIIAAQAGIHGRGFAVVANEIQELANRTSMSTHEISKVIKAVQNETHRAAGTIASAERSIAKGERLSMESEEALLKIVSGIQMSTERMNQIAVATSEQAKGSHMIRQAMEQVADMVEQIARATGEQSKGNELIMESAEKIKQLTSEVRLATKEQASVSNFIARIAEQNAEMINMIKVATAEQSQNSGQIVQSMCSIQESAQSNALSAQVLEEVIASLTRQVDLLRDEMGNFRL